MPELPEVETVRRGLEKALTGAVIDHLTLRRKDLRVPFPAGLAEKLAGKRIGQVMRRAKYLLFTLDSGDVLIAHLGMSGRFSVLPAAPVSFAAHDHAVFRLHDGRVAVFNDPRRFGLMALAHADTLATHPLLERLGPEPLEKGFSPAYLKKVLASRTGPVKPVLMQQEIVVGVGNIYASEALFLAGIDPRRPARDCTAGAAGIVTAIRNVLRDAIASGGSSLRDFLHVSGESGYFQHRFNVYGREGEPCFACQTPIIALRQSGRTSFYCKQCQR